MEAHEVKKLIKEAVSEGLETRGDQSDRRQVLEIGPLPFIGKLRASGRVVIATILVLAILVALYGHDWKSDQRATEFEARLNEVIYVLSLSESARAGLKLDMPESLRRKQGGRRHESDSSEDRR